MAKKLEAQEVVKLSINGIGCNSFEQAHETGTCLLRSLWLSEEKGKYMGVVSRKQRYPISNMFNSGWPNYQNFFFGKILGVGVEVSEHKKNENFQELVKALENIKANIPIKEIVEKSHCCMKFLQEILKLKENPSNEDFIFLTQKLLSIHDFQVPR